MIRNSSLGGYGYRKEEKSHAMELSLQTSHTVASWITGSGTGVDAFLKSIPGARRLMDIKRKLLLWRTGVIPGKPQVCKDVIRGLSPPEITL